MKKRKPSKTNLMSITNCIIVRIKGCYIHNTKPLMSNKILFQ